MSHKRSRYALAIASASLVPPIVVVAEYLPVLAWKTDSAELGAGASPWLVATFLVAWGVAALHATLIGLPVYLIVCRKKRVNALSAVTAGFIVGFIPTALFTFPYPGLYEGYSSGGSWFGGYVEFFENGAPTRYGWLSYLFGAIHCGVLGTLAAVVFWRIVRKLQPEMSSSDAAV